VPSAELSLQARVERIAAPLRESTAALAELLDDALAARVSRRLTGLGPDLEWAGPEPAPRLRAARFLVAVWLFARLRPESFAPGQTVAAANAHFWGAETPSPEPAEIGALRDALGRYGEDEAEGLFPYLLDPFGLTTRRALLAGVGDLAERRARKHSGTFYTPGDVARMLVAETIAEPDATTIDPACGAGVFLRAAFGRLCCDLDVEAERALGQLYGIDCEPCAIDACGLVLAHDWLARDPDRAPGAGAERWRRARRNLAVGNSLEAFAATAGEAPVWRRFSACAGVRFGCVLTNPPFAPTGERAGRRSARDYRTLSAAANPAGVNRAWPFVELALRAVGERGRIGVVLPLSLAYRRDAATAELRRLMAAGASWRLRFFDRAPDGVFGDDVKQRICLATARSEGPGRIATSRLIRWSSARRDRVFRPGAGAFRDGGGSDGAPLAKIGTTLEADVLRRLEGFERTLGDGLVEARLASAAALPGRCASAVAVAPTAYNWIGVYRDLELARAGRRAAAGKLSLLVSAGRREADAIYALLASRVFLWWWRARGDLFHVPLGALTGAPFPIDAVQRPALDALAGAGRGLWRRARRSAVSSTNRGVAVTAYRAPLLAAEIATADRAVVDAFGLPGRFARFASAEATRLAEAGRGEGG
jgi:hypothetical protein